MAKIRRSEVDVEEEKKILIASITDTNFLKSILQILQPEHLKTGFSQKIYLWLADYYKRYGEAPRQMIQDIYNVRKSELDPEEATVIGVFLSNLSELYEGSFNEGWYLDQAEKYLKKRSLEVHTEKVQSLLNLGMVEEAEHEQTKFKKIARLTASYSNPASLEEIQKFSEAKDDRLFKFPGVLGDLFGWWDREWLIAIQAPYNVGKTWFLREIAVLSLIKRLRVFEFSLEMSERRVKARHYSRLTGLPHRKDGEMLYPVMDCYLNQIGKCKRHERTNNVILFDPESSKPKFENAPKNFQACTACRKDAALRKHYVEASWFTTLKKELLSDDAISRKMKAFVKMYGDNHRLKSFPRFSANLSDIERQLDIADYVEGFVPDVIIIDYADILAPEDRRITNDEMRLNETWMSLARMAAERHALVVTATQVKTHVVEKKQSRGKMGDASGSARAKYGHTDFVFAAMQTDEEKRMKTIRVNVIKGRDDDFNEKTEVRVLQSLELGQTIVDSEYVN